MSRRRAQLNIVIFIRCLSQVSNVYEWSIKWGMKFSMDKSNIVIFANKHMKLPCNLSFKLGRLQMSIVRSYKYLGVNFDSNGLFKSHQLDFVLRKLMQVKYYILRLFHPNVFISPFIIRNLIKTIILPVITYGIGIWTYDSHFCKEVDAFICDILRLTIHGPC